MIYWKFKYSRTQRALAVGVSVNDIIEYCESQKYIDLKGNDVLKGGTTTMKLNTDMKLDLAWR